MSSPREAILASLHARLSKLSTTALRGEVLPERGAAAGLLILQDGEPGEPEVTLSPLAYHYQHRDGDLAGRGNETDPRLAALAWGDLSGRLVFASGQICSAFGPFMAGCRARLIVKRTLSCIPCLMARTVQSHRLWDAACAG